MKFDREIDFVGKKATVKWQSAKMEKDLKACAEYLKKATEDKEENALAKFWRMQADAMLTFKDGLPDIAFFESDEFPYGIMSEIFDFLYPSAKQI